MLLYILLDVYRASEIIECNNSDVKELYTMLSI